MSILSSLDIRDRVRTAAQLASHVAFKGIPSVRAALHGARVGAGAAFSHAVIERLGVQVLPHAAHAAADAVGAVAGEAALVLRRGGSVMRAGAKEFVLHAKDGLTLRVAPTGSSVAVSRDALRAIARTTPRAALVGVGRAAVSGAAAGAVMEGVVSGAMATRAVYLGQITGRAAVKRVAKHTARGAVAGGLGVAAAGAVAAGMAATGFAIVGTPVVVPVATMIAVGAGATRAFDYFFGKD